MRPSQFNQWQAGWNAAASLEKIAISRQNQQPLIRIGKADGQYIYNHGSSPAAEVSVPLKAVFSHQIVQFRDLCCSTLSSGPNKSSDTVQWSLSKTHCNPLNVNNELSFLRDNAPFVGFFMRNVSMQLH